MKEDMWHNYLYHVLFDNFASKEKCLKSALEAQGDWTNPIYSNGGCCGGQLRTESEMLLPGGDERTYITSSELNSGNHEEGSNGFNIEDLHMKNKDRINDITYFERPKSPTDDLDDLDRNLFNSIAKENYDSGSYFN